jgi:uncharacterized OsmC-like protein
MGELTDAPPKSAGQAGLMTTTTRNNGLDLDLLQGTVEEMRHDPKAATVTIRTRHQWDHGFAVNGYTEDFEEAGVVTPRTFTFRTDWPREIGGDDSGPSPGEAILGALGGCVAMTYVTKAATRGVHIDELQVNIEATVDLRGVFELAAVRAGLASAIVTVKVRSAADDATLDELGQAVTRASAVFDSLANPVPLRLAVQRLP